MRSEILQPGMDNATRSVWEPLPASQQRAPLARDTSTEVCVVGAGIAGLATAYQLARDGRKVLVLDAGSIGGGETARTTSHLSSVVDDRYFEIERIHGPESAHLVYDSHDTAIQWFAKTAHDERIVCDFASVDGYLFLPPGGDPSILERELEAAHRVGFTDAEMAPRAPLVQFDTGPCIRFPRQGQMDPMAFVRGLTLAIERMGGVIHGGSHVNDLRTHSGLSVHCDDGRSVRADVVVFATNTPVNDRVTIHTKQHAYLTYAIALPVAPGSIPIGLYWDTSQSADEPDGPYHYVRLLGSSKHDGQETLIVGGEDHRVGQADDAAARWGRLEAWARERFPVTGPLVSRWSGEVMETIDGVAFIGPDPGGPDGVYVVTGDSGMGMTHGAIAGMLISDLVAGRHNAWADLYDPARRKLRAAGAYAEENLNTAVQYKDWLQKGASATNGHQAPNTGAIVRRGLHLVARYCDDAGAVHECSAVCPHLGGIVRWNSGERSWDCPAHGSRFDPYGKVFHGPAVGSLESHEEQE
jgi:glycine/D-amino acid oxidase-like deaminating enzyme/nitrite reductase/ring-hydroxylating ferredoxin subunit